MKKAIAIITARGGSKRIPHKNVKEFCGRPIICYSIDAALRAGIFDEVMVSTDDRQIAEIARAAGAAVPFMRTAATAGDFAATDDVIKEVLAAYADKGIRFEQFCCLYPTAPFITPERLQTAMAMLAAAESVMPVALFSAPPQRSVLIENGRIKRKYPEYQNTRSQDLEKLYHDCGQFYACRTEAFMRAGTTDVVELAPLILPAEEVQDIDTPADWIAAEQKYLKQKDVAMKTAAITTAEAKTTAEAEAAATKTAEAETAVTKTTAEAETTVTKTAVTKTTAEAETAVTKTMVTVPTPFYRIKEADLRYDINLLSKALKDNWGNYLAGYSVKTNALPWLLDYLKKAGFYAEVVSATEYDLVRRIGYDDTTIIYNGPIKEQPIFNQILLNGGYLNMDSNQELDWAEELSLNHPEGRFAVGLRVNFDIAAACPDEEWAAEEGGRFGYCYENGVLRQAIRRIEALPNMTVSGLHLHTSTQSRTVRVYEELAKMAVKIAAEYQLRLAYVDMGGGYFGGLSDKPCYPDYFAVIGKTLKQYFDPAETKLIVEPGISLISRAISFETTVRDVKNIRGHKFIVTDGSRVNLNPLVTRHVYPHHIVYDEKRFPQNDREIEASQWVCGFTCMEYDRLFEIKAGKGLRPGDRIVYDTAGGYTMGLNPLFINYLPTVAAELSNGRIVVAREAWGNEEYLQKNYWR